MLALKVTGLVVTGGAILGLTRQAGFPYRQRVRVLEEWERALARLVPLIGWRHLPLKDACRLAVKGLPVIGPYWLRMVASLDDREVDFLTAFNTMVDHLPGLWADDRPVLQEVGRLLGQSAAIYQEALLARGLADVSRLLEEARQQSQSDGRVMPALVGAVGALLLILLL